MAIQTKTMKRWRDYKRSHSAGATVIAFVDPDLQEMIEGPLFVLRVHYRGFAMDVDAKITSAARSENMGSGFNFVSGERDIDYHYPTKRGAKAAQARVKALRIRTLRAQVKPYIY